MAEFRGFSKAKFGEQICSAYARPKSRKINEIRGLGLVDSAPEKRICLRERSAC
jgi:hypothetical protein